QGSFTSAAARLGVEQSTVSRRIAALEGSLGGLLFDRSALGLRPTELAESLLAHAERVEAEVHALRDRAHGSRGRIAGRVRLATTESFAVQVVIPEMLGRLKERHPELAIDLVLSDRAADLVQREADLAIRFFRSPHGDLIEKRVARLPFTVLAHERYAAKASNDPRALDWIVLELRGGRAPDAAYLAKHLPVTPAMTTTSHLAQVEAVRAGLGVALLARVLRRVDPCLVELDLDLPSAGTLDVHLVAPRTLRAVPRVAAVWQWLEEELRALG
ncbi:MAG: LysR family transcriptional regulator, partial [Polyangiaceae bacterium]|nr:LysR family transcriptional regulator [Polyangiaceae bacterium]